MFHPRPFIPTRTAIGNRGARLIVPSTLADLRFRAVGSRGPLQAWQPSVDHHSVTSPQFAWDAGRQQDPYCDTLFHSCPTK